MMENNNNARRVGTFTMGLYLVIAGIVAIFATFKPDFDFMLLLKLTPIVFVLLGIEVLIYHFALKTEKIKYDIFSIFICFILIGATICTACIPWAMTAFGPEREIKANQIEEELYNKCYEKLKDNKDILKMDTNVYFSYHMADYSNLTSKDTDTYLNIDLIPSINTTESFAKACKNILNNLDEIECNKIHFEVQIKDKQMTLNVYDKFARNLDVITLESMIDQTDE